jgi:hypothetical protein
MTRILPHLHFRRYRRGVLMENPGRDIRVRTIPAVDEYIKKAHAYFDQGYNCAETVLMVTH